MISTIRTTFLALAGTLALFALTGAQPASAAGPLPGRVGVHGELLDIEDETLTVQGRHGPISVIVDEVTFMRIIGEPDPALDDLHVGDSVLARGMRQDDGSIRAAFVAREPDGDRSVGRVISVSEASLILSAPDGVQIAVSVDADTIVAVGVHDTLWDDGGREAVREGMPLFVYGESSAGGTNVEAHTLLAIRPLRRRWARHGLAGQITAIDGDEMTVQTLGDETMTALTDENTRYHVPQVPDATLEDFAAGEHVIILGKRLEAEAFLARHILKRPQGRPVVGLVRSIDRDQLFLINRSGLRLTVTVDEDTRYRVGRDTSATLDDFSAGHRVLVFGRVSQDGSEMHARLVARRQRSDVPGRANSP